MTDRTRWWRGSLRVSRIRTRPIRKQGPSVTDQRQRFVLSCVVAPNPFRRDHEWLGLFFNNWKASGVITVGSGRPVSATVTGDANQDGNDNNDRLPGVSRDSLLGPDYATADLRLTCRLYAGDRVKLELMAESFNLLNRDNRRVQITQDGFITNSAQFVQTTNTTEINIFPAEYRVPSSFLKATDAYAPRQIQLALKLIF